MLREVSSFGLTLIKRKVAWDRSRRGSWCIADDMTLGTIGHVSLHSESTKESNTILPRSLLIVIRRPR